MKHLVIHKNIKDLQTDRETRWKVIDFKDCAIQ